MEDFPDVARFLQESRGAETVRDGEELYRAWKDVLENPKRAENMGQKAYDAWRTSRGSVQTYVFSVRAVSLRMLDARRQGDKKYWKST